MPISEHAGIWSVVKVPYPYTDRPTRQSRPALVIAETGRESGLPLLWVLMVTSAENRGWPGDVPISDWALAGLPLASVVRTEKIATVDCRDVTCLGTLAPGNRSDVAERLRSVLADTLRGEDVESDGPSSTH
ncbi:MAG: type II toxin-antitoxin system PemK/MazF family toxin [Rhodospirillales bacterium]|nr:type II toxin-antitoxin system PemK/MazF family toxin [Rhodospirillales bacterium]